MTAPFLILKNYAPIPFPLILRSRAQRGVSKDGQHQDCFPPFETGAMRPPQGEV